MEATNEMPMNGDSGSNGRCGHVLLKTLIIDVSNWIIEVHTIDMWQMNDAQAGLNTTAREGYL